MSRAKSHLQLHESSVKTCLFNCLPLLSRGPTYHNSGGTRTRNCPQPHTIRGGKNPTSRKVVCMPCGMPAVSSVESFSSLRPAPIHRSQYRNVSNTANALACVKFPKVSMQTFSHHVMLCLPAGLIEVKVHHCRA